MSSAVALESRTASSPPAFRFQMDSCRSKDRKPLRMVKSSFWLAFTMAWPMSDITSLAEVFDYARDYLGLLKAAFRGQNPVLYYEHKRLYRTVKQAIPKEDFIVPLGKASVPREGRHVTVVSYSLMLQRSLEAAAILAEEGIEAEVVDLRTLAPYDHETILNSVRKTARCAVVYESSRTMGVGTEIAAMVAQDGFPFLDAPVVRISPPDAPQEPFAPNMAEHYLPDAKRIAQEIRTLVAY